MQLQPLTSVYSGNLPEEAAKHYKPIRRADDRGLNPGSTKGKVGIIFSRLRSSVRSC